MTNEIIKNGIVVKNGIVGKLVSINGISMGNILTQIQEELYKEYKGKRIPANEGNGNIVIGQEFLDDIFNFVSIRVIEKVNQVVLPKVQKFIDKVESGRARSKETYNDMKEIRDFLSTLIEQK